MTITLKVCTAFVCDDSVGAISKGDEIPTLNVQLPSRDPRFQ